MIFTIGHSTRSFDEFAALLQENDVRRLADIRRYPGSKRLPHFSREALEAALTARGIDYVHFVDLGGRRNPLPDSPNTAWRNEQFRGYADWMSSTEFRAAVERLLDSNVTTAVMCAEAVPWRCHRNILSDELVRRGITVLHILGPRSIQEHKLSAHASLEADRVIYPGPQGGLFSTGL